MGTVLTCTHVTIVAQPRGMNCVNRGQISQRSRLPLIGSITYQCARRQHQTERIRPHHRGRLR